MLCAGIAWDRGIGQVKVALSQVLGSAGSQPATAAAPLTGWWEVGPPDKLRRARRRAVAAGVHTHCLAPLNLLPSFHQAPPNMALL